MLAIITAILNSLVPFLVGRFLDALASAVKGGSLAVAYKVLFAWFFVYLLSVLVIWLTRRIAAKIEYQSDAEFNSRAMNMLLMMPVAFHKNQKAGKVRYKIEKAASRVGWFINLFFNQYAVALMSIISGLVMSFYISVPLAIFCFWE